MNAAIKGPMGVIILLDCERMQSGAVAQRMRRKDVADALQIRPHRKWLPLPDGRFLRTVPRSTG